MSGGQLLHVPIGAGVPPAADMLVDLQDSNMVQEDSEITQVIEADWLGCQHVWDKSSESNGGMWWILGLYDLRVVLLS